MGVLKSDESQTLSTNAAKEREPACASESFEERVLMTVVRFSGEPLLQNVYLSVSDKVSNLRELANTQLLEDASNDACEVSAFVTVEGVRLGESTTFKENGLAQSSIVTAVVIPVDELQDIESMFHDLMKTRELIPASSFPSLKAHFELQGNGGSAYYETPGMYGGFHTTLSKDEGAEPGSQWQLQCKFWNDFCERYGEAHNITRKQGVVQFIDDAVYSYNQ